MKKPESVEQYLSWQTPAMAEVLMKLRQIIKKAAPKAEELISYSMPAFKQDGILVYYAAFKNHYSLFPASTAVLTKFKKQLAGYKTSKGTIQFDPEEPIPARLITEIVKFRLKENKAKAGSKRSRK